jgi:hypothetical protein
MLELAVLVHYNGVSKYCPAVRQDSRIERYLSLGGNQSPTKWCIQPYRVRSPVADEEAIQPTTGINRRGADD